MLCAVRRDFRLPKSHKQLLVYPQKKKTSLKCRVDFLLTCLLVSLMYNKRKLLLVGSSFCSLVDLDCILVSEGLL